MRKGIILAGGSGTRLHPITLAITKHLLPVYDKPMIYYSLSTLMLANIRDVLLICNNDHLNLYKQLLGDGSRFGIRIFYEIQERPNGIAEALIIGEDFLKNDPCALILGDNIFYGPSFQKTLITSSKNISKATIFSYSVKNPSQYGIVQLSKNKIVKIEEKPKDPKSNLAITGLYLYPKNVSKIAKKIKPSQRNELEITDLNKLYLKKNKLKNVNLGRGFTWLDAGTIDSLFEASLFVKTIQSRQGSMICCPEEISFEKKYFNKNELKKIANNIKSQKYKKYILSLISNAK